MDIARYDETENVVLQESAQDRAEAMLDKLHRYARGEQTVFYAYFVRSTEDNRDVEAAFLSLLGVRADVLSLSERPVPIAADGLGDMTIYGWSRPVGEKSHDANYIACRTHAEFVGLAEHFAVQLIAPEAEIDQVV